MGASKIGEGRILPQAASRKLNSPKEAQSKPKHRILRPVYVEKSNGDSHCEVYCLALLASVNILR